MEDRRSYSVVQSGPQLRLLAILTGVFLGVFLLGGGVTYYLLGLLEQALSHVPTDGQWVWGAITYRLALVAITSLLILFVGMFLAIRETHRIVGPLYRLERELELMRESGDVELVDIRDDDQIHDFVRELNQLLRDYRDRKHHDPDDNPS